MKLHSVERFGNKTGAMQKADSLTGSSLLVTTILQSFVMILIFNNSFKAYSV